MTLVDSTLADIVTKVRRLTASPDTQQISDADIEDYINQAYIQDFPAEIKDDIFKDVVEIFVHPYQDRYALSGAINTTGNTTANTTANTYESVREPVYVEGRRATFYKDRGQFYNQWPRTAGLNTSLTGGTTGTISSIDVTGDPTISITVPINTNLVNGLVITFTGIEGSTELNGNEYTISNVSSTATETTFEVTQAGTTAYTGSGTYIAYRLAYTLTLSAPVLPFECVIGYLGKDGTYVKVEDGGDGTLYLANTTTSVGSVVYSTGAFTFNFLTAPANGETINVWYYTYSPGRPTSVMFWKNELVVRPVPDKVYRVQVEAYKFPSAMSSSQTPEIKQWMQYLALLAATKILADRQDMEGLENLVPLLDRQQRLIKNRKANDQIGRRNVTIYTAADRERYLFPYNYVG